MSGAEHTSTRLKYFKWPLLDLLPLSSFRFSCHKASISCFCHCLPVSHRLIFQEALTFLPNALAPRLIVLLLQVAVSRTGLNNVCACASCHGASDSARFKYHNNPYIGETVRNLVVRIAEYSNPAYTFEPAKHLRENPSHSFTWGVLSLAQTFHKRRIVEGLMIQQFRPSLNKQVISYVSKLFPSGIT